MSGFIHALAEFRFLQLALLACLLASIGCGVMGTFVVVRRVGAMAGGIAHAVLAGMGIAYFLGNSPILGATVAALVSAFLIGIIKLRWRQDEEILIAAFWSVGMAIGVLFISKTPGYSVNLMSYLFGNVLLISGADVARMLVLDVVILATVGLFYRQFLAAAFDEEFAELRGVNVEFFYILMLSLIALTVVLLIQIVGLILVIALLILPAASVSQFAGTLPRIMAASALLSMAVTFTGLGLSYAPDLPAGATIIVVAGVVYAGAVVLQRLLLRRRKRRLAEGA
jgi:zinc transport system permease protein